MPAHQEAHETRVHFPAETVCACKPHALRRSTRLTEPNETDELYLVPSIAELRAHLRPRKLIHDKRLNV